MAAPVVVKPFRICLRRPLKNPKDSLSTITIHKFCKSKTIRSNAVEKGNQFSV